MTQVALDRPANSGYLFGPVADFLCLGGGSLFLLAFAVIFLPQYAPSPASSLAGLPLFVAILLNFPHFINSYQLFYTRFREKVLSRENPLRLRFIFAGVIVPVTLSLVVVWELVSKDSMGVLAFGSAYFFLTYWHYAKQGYGIFIVETVMKRHFFEGWEKQLLLVNSYVVFLVAWIVTNSRSARRELIGKSIENVAIPEFVLIAAWVVLAVSAACVLFMLFRRIRDNKPVTPVGLASYLTTYAWLLLDVDKWFFIIPAAHSLQYLTTVWRFKLNEYGSTSMAPKVSFALFVALGIFGGIVAFIVLPIALDSLMDPGLKPEQTGLFFFFIPIFINIHHFFIDNVIWRHENKEVSRYLMNAPR